MYIWSVCICNNFYLFTSYTFIIHISYIMIQLEFEFLESSDLVDCPTQLILYLYLSVVFHDKYQNEKYEEIQQGNLLQPTLVNPRSGITYISSVKLLHAAFPNGLVIFINLQKKIIY